MSEEATWGGMTEGEIIAEMTYRRTERMGINAGWTPPGRWYIPRDLARMCDEENRQFVLAVKGIDASAVARPAEWPEEVAVKTKE